MCPGSGVHGEVFEQLLERRQEAGCIRAVDTLQASTGFVDVTYQNLSFGIACIHLGTKPPHGR